MAAEVDTKYNEKKRYVALDTLFTLLYKGIDNMEAGRLNTVDGAF